MNASGESPQNIGVFPRRQMRRRLRSGIIIHYDEDSGNESLMPKDTIEIAKIRKIIERYFRTMKNRSEMTLLDVEKIMMARSKIRSILDYISMNNILMKSDGMCTPDEKENVIQYRIIQTIATRIVEDTFPPKSYGIIHENSSLFPPPSSKYLRNIKQEMKKSSKTKVIRDHNHVEDRKRIGLHLPTRPDGLAHLTFILGNFLPLHTMGECTGILSTPGKNNQAFHTDYKGLTGNESPYKVMPYWLFAACEPETFLWYYSEDAGRIRLEVGVGGCIIGAGNAIHSGSAYEVDNFRVHVYLDSEMFMHDSRSQDFTRYVGLQQPPTTLTEPEKTLNIPNAKVDTKTSLTSPRVIADSKKRSIEELKYGIID